VTISEKAKGKFVFAESDSGAKFVENWFKVSIFCCLWKMPAFLLKSCQ